MLFWKLLTLGLALVILWHMAALWKIGKKMSVSRDEYLLARHRSIVACIGCLTLLIVVLVEFQVRVSSAPYVVNPWLLGLHLLAIGIVVIVGSVAVLRYTGLKDSRLHKRLAYSFFAFYALALATGSLLLYQLPA